MELWEKLRNLRKEKGLTYEQLVSELNNEIGISTIKAYESISADNRRYPTKRSIDILSKFYNVPIEYLLYDEVTNKTKNNIDINKELGLSDIAIEKFKNIKSNNLRKNSINKWIENNEEFEYIFPIQLNRYYYLINSIKNIQYFAYINDILEIIQKMKKKELLDFCSLLKKKVDEIVSESDFETENFLKELYELIDKLKEMKNIKDICMSLSITGDALYETLIRDLKFIKFELSESFSRSLPVKYTSPFTVYYEDDKPSEYINLIKNFDKS